MQWRVEVTRDQLPHLVQRLEWTLQHQNRRFSDRMPTQKLSPGARRALVLVLSLLCIALVALLWALDPRGFARDRGWWLAALAFFTLTFVASFFLGSLRAWSKRFAGRMMAFRAARLMRPFERRLPAVLDYELHTDRVTVHCDVVPGVKPLSLSQGLVVAADDLLVVFRRRGSLTPIRKLHVLGAEERRALLAAFAQHGTECVEVTGPAEGYVDPLPPARTV
jgi:hypothetical protein